MKTRNGIAFLLIFFILVYFQNISAQDSDSISTTRYLQAIRDTFPEVPGIYAIAVDHDRVLFTASAGYADPENKMPFTPQTDLYIASNTKAFVGLAMAQLSTQGKISYNDPMVKYLDADWFPDSLNAGEVTIGNLLGHTHGYSNDVLTFRTAFAGNAPDSVLPGLLQFTSWYREPGNRDFRYCNLSYLLAGMVIEKVTGISWRDYLSDSLFIPDGLLQTTPYISEFQKGNIAKPFVYTPSGDIPGMIKSDNTMHAAGGLISTADDMGRWLRLFINDGNYDGKTYFNSKTIRQATQTLVADTGRMGPFMRYGYASGWITGSYNDEKLLFHFGSYPGYGSMMSFMPDKKIGIFVFVNEGKSGMMISAMALTYIYDLLLGKPHDPQITSMIKNMVKKTFDKQSEAPSQPLVSDDFQIKEKTGFISEKYGKLLVYPGNGHVYVRLGNLVGQLYRSDSAGKYITDWIPGSAETLMLEKHGSECRVKYEDYGIFVSEHR